MTREGDPDRLTARRVLYISAKTCALRGWKKAQWLEAQLVIASYLLAHLNPGDLERIAECVTWQG